MKPFALFLVVFLSLNTVLAQNDSARQLYPLFDAEWQWNLEKSL